MRGAPSIDFTLTAWIDESIVVGSDGVPGTYTLAAAVADPSECDDIRDRLRSLTVGRSERLHWAHESPKRRDAIATLIAAVDIAAVVVVGSPMVGAKQERARRCCLEHLLYELGRAGVSDVWRGGYWPCLRSSAGTTSTYGRKREGWVPPSGGVPSLTSRSGSARELC